MRSWIRTAGALLAVFAAAATGRLEAQGVTTGAVSGYVQDSAGAPLGNAQVLITYLPTGFRTAATTNANGLYLAQGLEPGGPYEVVARAIGYRTMLLDTSFRQREAQALYRRLGFRDIAPYYELPEELRSWLVFMELPLR